MKQINFNNYRDQITENDVDQILKIIAYRCHLRTWQRLRSILTYSLSSIPHKGILERLIKEKDTWTYVAGQSYDDEIKTVREIILK